MATPSSRLRRRRRPRRRKPTHPARIGTQTGRANLLGLFVGCYNAEPLRSPTPRTMSMLFRKVLILACFLPFAALAQPRTYIGFSGTSCGTWVAERKKSPMYAMGMEAWALGVVSGSNWSSDGKDRLEGLDAEAVY